MKARNFRYVRPASLQEAYRMLAEAGGEAVPIAGGQSLLAGLNMRLSSPKVLVDIGNLAELTGQSYADGMVRLGALTRHRDLLSSAIVRAHLPLLAEAAPHIGHAEIVAQIDLVELCLPEDVGHRRRIVVRIGQLRHVLIFRDAHQQSECFASSRFSTGRLCGGRSGLYRRGLGRRLVSLSKN